MKVSIAMATYNGAAYLEEQLESFVAQTRLPDELVVSDDGSTDATVPILQGFARKAPFSVRIYKNTRNLGYARNFEGTIRSCTGDVIFLSDQDDVWFPKKLERVCGEFAKDASVLAIINDAAIVNEDLSKTGLTKRGQTMSLGLPDQCFITGCCTAVRKVMLPLVLPIPESEEAHDAWLHAVANRLDVRRSVDETLQYYRRHGHNASHAPASHVRRVGWMDRLRVYAPEDPRVWCSTRLRRLEQLRVRIEKEGHSVLAPLGMDERVAGAFESIDAERAAVSARMALLGRVRAIRWLPGLLMYARGQYKPFSGLKSLAKDVLRP